jgi:hypothetical protein
MYEHENGMESINDVQDTISGLVAQTQALRWKVARLIRLMRKVEGAPRRESGGSAQAHRGAARGAGAGFGGWHDQRGAFRGRRGGSAGSRQRRRARGGFVPPPHGAQGSRPWRGPGS